MTTLVAQIAPQRNTQYTALASALAPYELQVSPLGPAMSEIQPLRLGGQDYLKFDLPTEPDDHHLRELGMCAMTAAFFEYYDQLGQVSGPLLRPLETRFEPALPPDLIETRRYRGKTNELLTRFLCNLARWSSGLADQPWSNLRVFDPLAGGGTTLLAALVLGAQAAGIERDAQDVTTTAVFIKQYMREARIFCQVKEEHWRKIGRRWSFTLGQTARQQCLLTHGDTRQAESLLTGFKPHLIVTDLPYGIQHQGELVTLLTEALPVWTALLPPDGAIVWAWESTRFPRSEMIALVEAAGRLKALNQPPYNLLAHRVDRVIKQRDVLVALPVKGVNG